MTIVIVIADGGAVAVAAGERSQACDGRHVLECAVALVAEETVSLGRRGRRDLIGQVPTLNAIDVEPAVAVVIDQGDSAAHRFGETAQGRGVVLVDEPKPGDLCIVVKYRRSQPGGGHADCSRGCCQTSRNEISQGTRRR